MKFRFVEIYVNEVGLQAYKEDAPIPVGSIVVKPSWENQERGKGRFGAAFCDGKDARGLRSRPWRLVLRVSVARRPRQVERRDGRDPDWRSPSTKIESCSGCHDNLKRNLGMPPKERQWR